MTSLLGDETSRYDFDEGSLPILDKVGSKDSTGSGGSPTLTGSSLITDGATDHVLWSTVGQAFSAQADHTVYILFKYLDTVEGGDKVILGPNPNGFSTEIAWKDALGETIRLHVDNTGSNALDLDVGRNLTNSEIIALAYSYVASSKTQTMAIKSTGGLLADGSQVGDNAPSNLGMVLGANGPLSSHSNIEYKQMGVIAGTARSLVDLQDTVAELISDLNVDGNFRNSLLYKFPRGFDRFVRT